MNMHKNARLTIVRRIEMVREMTERAMSPAAAGAAHGVSAPTARKWLGRYLAEGKAGLLDRSATHQVPDPFATRFASGYSCIGMVLASWVKNRTRERSVRRMPSPSNWQYAQGFTPLRGGLMAIEVRKTFWWDTLRLQIFVSVPAFLWGLVAPNRLFVSLLSRWDEGQSTIRFLGKLRQKYRSDHLWVWFPGGRTLLVLGREGMDAVLASEDNAADPALKKRPLSRFVPDSLVISSGNEWQDRRRFNEDALGFREPCPHFDGFREIVFGEVDRLGAGRAGELRWADFQTLGERISHQVLLGRGQIKPDMTAQLAGMVRRSNWFILPRHRRYFSAFYERIERHLARHRAFITDSGRERRSDGDPVSTRCLMHESAKALECGDAAELTKVPRQIGFWFFVLKDALELHVARTLALIAAHPEVQDRVRAEIRDAPPLTAQSIDGLRYLEACLHEQLRLWTPVPILLRRAVRSFSLPGGIRIEPGQQILIHAGYYHRDPGVFGEIADRFSPDAAGKGIPPVYFFSQGRQSCAGQFLARFMVKATLASLLAGSRFELVGPGMERARIPCSYDHFKIVLRSVADG